jgi:hypothetical protein
MTDCLLLFRFVLMDGESSDATRETMGRRTFRRAEKPFRASKVQFPVSDVGQKNNPER